MENRDVLLTRRRCNLLPTTHIGTSRGYSYIHLYAYAYPDTFNYVEVVQVIVCLHLTLDPSHYGETTRNLWSIQYSLTVVIG